MTGDSPNLTNRQTTASLKKATSEEEVFQPPTLLLTCTGNFSILDTRGTNLVQPIKQTTYQLDPVEEDMDFLEDIIEIFVDEGTKEEQIWLNKDSLPQTQAILHNN